MFGRRVVGITHKRHVAQRRTDEADFALDTMLDHFLGRDLWNRVLASRAVVSITPAHHSGPSLYPVSVRHAIGHILLSLVNEVHGFRSANTSEHRIRRTSSMGFACRVESSL